MCRRQAMDFAVIAALGIAVLVVYKPIYRSSSVVDSHNGHESFALADSILATHTFSNPFRTPTGPSAHLPPLYPAYLAMVIGVFGRGAKAVAMFMWLASGMLALQVMFLPILARRLGLGFSTGVVASLGWLASGIPPTQLWDATMVGMFVLFAVFVMERSFETKISRFGLILTGLCWATLLLLQPVSIVILGAWLILLSLHGPMSLRQRLVVGCLPLLLVSPWLVRNYLVFHTPVFIRDNLGLELAVSNNACATAVFEQNQIVGCIAQTHPNFNYGEAERVRTLGEIEYNRVRLREALAWIEAHPSAFSSLTIQRFVAFWVPPTSRNAANGTVLRPAILGCFSLLSVLGLLVMWRNARTAAYILGIWLVFYPLIYYFVQVLPRYRYPVLWASFLAGSYFVVEVVRGIIAKNVTSEASTNSELRPAEYI